MAKICYLLLALGCLLSASSAQNLFADVKPEAKDVLLLYSPETGTIDLHQDARDFLIDIQEPIRFVAFTGPVHNTNRMMHFVVDRPYVVQGPPTYGVEFWPKLMNISVPHKTKLMSIHYDHDVSVFSGDALTEAKLIAIMTLVSSHMIYNFDHIPPRHPLKQFEFLAQKRIPALILRDLIKENYPSELININWPKIRSFIMAYDGSFEEFCREHEFPEYLWPDFKAKFSTGRYGSKHVPCGSFIKAMTEDHDSFTVVKEDKFIDLSKEVHHSSTGSNMIRFIEVLLELVNGPRFEKEWYRATENLQSAIDHFHNHFVNKYGEHHQHLGGKPTKPTPLEPRLPPRFDDEL